MILEIQDQTLYDLANISLEPFVTLGNLSPEFDDLWFDDFNATMAIPGGIVSASATRINPHLIPCSHMKASWVWGLVGYSACILRWADIANMPPFPEQVLRMGPSFCVMAWW